MKSFVVSIRVPEYEKGGWIYSTPQSYSYKDLEVTVDDDRYDDVIKHNWSAFKNKNTFYVRARISSINNKYPTLLHHYLIGMPLPGYVVDHKSGNGWECSSDNIRIVTTRQNAQNRKNKKSSVYPGVDFYKRDRKYRAAIRVNGERKLLGMFEVEEDAFLAYQAAIRKLGQEVLDYGA